MNVCGFSVMEEKTSVLLVTANVGSIFEDPDVMLKLWIEEFLQTVSRLEAKFIALHCQEVGGKNYETRMQHVENFVQMLLSCHELQQFDKAEIFLDEDFSCAENFTALGNFYFVHESLLDVLIWNFDDLKFEKVNARNVHSGNIENVPIKEKSKFPQNFFPECKWSRKGYLRTRWQLNGTTFDLVNIHLFHDASNFVAMQTFPSVYTITRQKALQYTLNRFYNYEEGSAPFFLFGDFNFRTDTRGVIRKLTTGLSECRDGENVDDGKLEYKDDACEVIITIGKKEFSHLDHQNVFINDAGDWLKEYDREMEAFKDQLFEYPVQFLPSYPFEENSTSGQSYMKTRCPAWCDRVLLSMTAKQLINEKENCNNTEYSVIGKESCMGDHKPVYLFFDLVNGAGTISTKLPIKPVCSACRVNNSCGSVFCDTFNDASAPVTASTIASKSHASCSALRNDSSPPVVSLPCATGKKHHRNVSRCCDTNISVMSIVTEISDRASDQDTADSDASYYLANSALPTTNNSRSVDYSNLHEYRKRCCAQHGEMENASLREKVKSQFAEDNVSLNRYRDAKFAPKDFVSRSFDECVAVRSNSACTVIESSWRSKTCTCLQDGAWRMRSISTSSHTSSWNSDGRVRLKSDPNLKTSLLRLQSHHSSSEEEWFEEVDEPDSRKSKDTLANATEDIQEYIEFDAVRTDTEVDGLASTSFTQDGLGGKQQQSRKARYFLFCIPRRWKRDEGVEGRLSDCKFKNGRYFKFLPWKSRKSRWCCTL